MEQSQPLPTPATRIEAQHLKKNNTAKIIAGITSVIAIAGITFGIYEIIQNQSKDQQISELKSKYANSTDTSANKNDENSTKSEVDNTEAKQEKNPEYTYKLPNYSEISFELPENWQIFTMQNYTDQDIGIKIVPTTGSATTLDPNHSDFSLGLLILGSFDGQQRPTYFSALGYSYDGTPKSLIDSFGSYGTAFSDNDSEINGNPAYCREKTEDQLNYRCFIVGDHQNVVSAGTYFYTPADRFTGTEAKDFSEYKTDVEKIIRSIKIKST